MKEMKVNCFKKRNLSFGILSGFHGIHGHETALSAIVSNPVESSLKQSMLKCIGSLMILVIR